MLGTWSLFALCLTAILIAGTKLSHYGDVIAEKSGLGRSWVGVLLLATVTSLPELFTGVSAVTLTDTPDITMGDLMGSCVFNLVLIAIVDALHRPSSIYTRVGQGHFLSAGLGIVAIGFVGFSLVLAERGIAPALGHMSLAGIVILAFYPFAARLLFRFELRQQRPSAEELQVDYDHLTLTHAITGYALAATVVVAAAIGLPFVGVRLAVEMGWSETFVGTLFIALATSVPELVVTVAAVRMGALDMAVGNILGSNLFNVWIIGLLDVLYVQGPIFAHVSPLHVSTALSAVMMSGITVVGLIYRPKGRVANTVTWVSVILLTIFVMNSYLLFRAQP